MSNWKISYNFYEEITDTNANIKKCFTIFLKSKEKPLKKLLKNNE